MTAAISYKPEAGKPAALLRLLGRPKPALPELLRSSLSAMDDSPDVAWQSSAFDACLRTIATPTQGAPTGAPSACDAMDACDGDVPLSAAACEVWGSSRWRICTGPEALAQAAASGAASTSATGAPPSQDPGAEGIIAQQRAVRPSPLAARPPMALPVRCVVQQVSPPRPTRPGFVGCRSSSSSGCGGCSGSGCGGGQGQLQRSPSPPRRQHPPSRWRSGAAIGHSHGCGSDVHGAGPSTPLPAAAPQVQLPPSQPLAASPGAGGATHLGTSASASARVMALQHSGGGISVCVSSGAGANSSGWASDSDWDSDSDAERGSTGRAVRRRRAAGGDGACASGGGGGGQESQVLPTALVPPAPAPRHKPKSRLCEQMQVLVSESLTAALTLGLQQSGAAAAVAARSSGAGGGGAGGGGGGGGVGAAAVAVAASGGRGLECGREPVPRQRSIGLTRKRLLQ